MRYRFVPAPVPAAVALALLTSLALSGCGADKSDNGAPASTAAAADTTRDDGAGTTGTTAASTASRPAGVVLADGRHPAFLKSVDLASRTIVIDVVQFFTGAEAARAASEDGQESPPPNDYYIRNTNQRLRTLPVPPSARISVNILANDETGDATKDLSVDFPKLASYFPTEVSPLFWVTVRDDQVNTLQEQYLP
jgi:hypothetical protein